MLQFAITPVKISKCCSVIAKHSLGLAKGMQILLEHV